jgi:hypothetical protein
VFSYTGNVWQELKDAYEEHITKPKVKMTPLTDALGAALTGTAQENTTGLGTLVQFNAGVVAALQTAHAEETAPVAKTLIPPSPPPSDDPPSSLV